MATTITAKHSFLRMSPRKVRGVSRVVVGKTVPESEALLTHLNKGATDPILRLIQSASSNAKHVYDLEKNQLFVKNLIANDGPTLKRFKPRAYGRAGQIRKRMTHLELTLGVLDTVKEEDIKKKDTGKLSAPKAITDVKELDKEQEVPAEEKDTQPIAADGTKKEAVKKDATKSSDGEKVDAVKPKAPVSAPQQDKGPVDTKAQKGQSKGFMNKVFNRKVG